MTRDEIRHAIIEELSALAPETNPASLQDGEDIREALDLDSMDMLNLMIALHRRLEVEIPDEDAGQFATLAGALDYIAARVPAR
jgi:acyl carrier protein